MMPIVVKNRRSLTPSTGMPSGEDVHATRRGGIRVILEEKVELGSDYEVTVSTGADAASPVQGRIVWVQEEPDGVVAGIEFR